MDPTACYQTMLESYRRGDLAAAVMSARAILKWVARGGFLPAGVSGPRLAAMARRVIQDHRDSFRDVDLVD